MAGEQAKNNKDFSDVANGPIAEGQRQCRDVICCLLFMVNLVAMGYCAIQGYANGDTSKLWRATDQYGAICGDSSGPAKDYPYSYFYNPITGVSKRFCFKTCPVYDSAGAIATPQCYNCSSPTWGTVSSDGTTISPVAATTYLLYGTTALLGRICIPEVKMFEQIFNSVKNTFYSAVDTGTFANFINDIRNNWQWILAAFGFSVVLSFVFMYALKCLAGLIVWLSIFGIIGFVVALGCIFFYNGGGFGQYSSFVGYLGIPTYEANGNYQIYAYICFGIAALLFIILLCCCSRIRLAVAVCKAAGQFVARVCSVVLVPIWQTILVACLWAPGLVAIIYLASSASFKVIKVGDVFTSIESYTEEKLIYLYYFVFGTLWTNAILQAMGIFVIASACAMWYYAHGPGQELDSPILRSYKMIFRYHFGSLAFGSLILAIVQFMQLLVEAFKKQAENTGADKNPCFEYVINCIRCCLACVERIVQFINKTAYIQIAIRGKNFCSAAADGFEIVWSNALRYSIVGGVGQILMFIGKLLISAGTTLAFYCLVTFVPSIKQTILQPILILIIVFVIAYAVSTLFMAVYSIAMDTLLACFIIDETNQKAKGGKAPLYAPEELAELIDRD